MGTLSPWHILLVALVVIVVFGSKRLPDTARSLGKSMRILKSETRAMKSEEQAATGGTATTAETSSPAEPSSPRSIQAAPGDVDSSRPVQEPKGTSNS